MTSGLRTIVLLITLYTDTVLTECSAGCTSCSGSTCFKCHSAYFLSSGFCSLCPEQCQSCNGYDDCTSCIPGKWGSDNQCQFNCKDNCYNKECQYDTGYCVRCTPGLYGLNCQHDCTVCEGGLCELRSCTERCKQGYYEYKTEYNELICQSCPSDCRYCNDAQTCRVCNDDFHLFQFHLNGQKYVHCVGCSLGSNCSNVCAIINCNLCKIQIDSLVCTDCPAGYIFIGSNCIPNTSTCNQECSTHCNEDGTCLGSCNAGWTGERCSDQCSDKCLTCNQNNSDICQQCKGDFYTVNCDTACSPSCIIQEGKQTCRLTDGYCLNGCEHNFWGDFCDQSCSSGCNNNDILVCDRNNGTCIHGCKDGYIGDNCDTSKKTTEEEITIQKVSTKCDCKEHDDSKSNFVEGFFSGLGTSVVVVAVTVVLFKIRRWYVAKKLKSQQISKKTIEMPTYYNETVRMYMKHREKLADLIIMSNSAIRGTWIMFTMI